MDSQTQTILVPTDFSTVADYAIEHAVMYSKILNKEITLLHIIKREIEYKEAEDKIRLLAERINKESQIGVHTIIREGSIFSTIGEVSNELESELVIMGTHGIHGMQKIPTTFSFDVVIEDEKDDME